MLWIYSITIFIIMQWSKTNIVLTYFFQHDFDRWKFDFISMYFFLPNFDGRKIEVVSMYIFAAVSMENWCKFDMLNLMCFWKTKNRGLFDSILISPKPKSFDASFGRNFVSRHYFKVISFHFEFLVICRLRRTFVGVFFF